MLKNKSKIVVLLITILLLISTVCFATEDNTVVLYTNPDTTTDTTTDATTDATTDESATESTVEIYDGDLYLIDNDIVMDQLVDGNVFILGKNVTISGKVNGSLFVFADNVTLEKDAYIVQTFYVCANHLTLTGVANDLYAACSNIDMYYDSFMIRDLRVTASTFNFYGGVGRDAFITANNFNFSTETSNSAIIYGNLSYKSSNELNLTEEFVEGTINYSKLETSKNEESLQNIILEKVLSFAKALLYTVAVFLLALWITPKFVEKSSNFVGLKLILAFGIGAIACVVAILLSFILFLSKVGMPISIAIIALLALMISISFAVTTIAITNKITNKFKFEKKYLRFITLVVVSLILWALQQIPYAGWIISAIISLLGFGIIVLYLFTKNSKKQNVEVKE